MVVVEIEGDSEAPMVVRTLPLSPVTVKRLRYVPPCHLLPSFSQIPMLVFGYAVLCLLYTVDDSRNYRDPQR